MAVETEARLLLRMPEAAALLGVSRSKAYELAGSGDLPIVRLGRSLRVPAEGLDEWIRRNTTGGDSGSAVPARAALPEADRDADGPTHLRPF
jgi:excisionase family DNA binding protein